MLSSGNCFCTSSVRRHGRRRSTLLASARRIAPLPGVLHSITVVTWRTSSATKATLWHNPSLSSLFRRARPVVLTSLTRDVATSNEDGPVQPQPQEPLDAHRTRASWGLADSVCLGSGIRSAINGQIRPGDVGRLRTGDERHQRGDLVDATVAVERCGSFLRRRPIACGWI